MWKSHTACGTGLKHCVLLIADRLLLRRIAHRLDRVVALAVIGGQLRCRGSSRSRCACTSAQPRSDKVSKSSADSGKRHARKVDAQELGVARAVCRRVQNGVDVAEDFFWGVVVLVASVDEGAEAAGARFSCTSSSKRQSGKT